MTPMQATRARVLKGLLETREMTSAEVIQKTGWRHWQFIKAAQSLRDLLAEEGSTITLVADPHGYRGPWLYRLIDGAGVVDPDTTIWFGNRVDDMERRIKTVKAVLDPSVRVLDGRSVRGKKARIYQLHITRALEEVGFVDGDNGDGLL